MKLGVSMYSYVSLYKKGEMGIVEFIETAKSIGVDGVELLDFFWKDRDAELPLVDAALAKTGLPVGVYSVGNDLVSEDPAERAKQVAVIKGGVDNAVHFGAKGRARLQRQYASPESHLSRPSIGLSPVCEKERNMRSLRASCSRSKTTVYWRERAARCTNSLKQSTTRP